MQILRAALIRSLKPLSRKNRSARFTHRCRAQLESNSTHLRKPIKKFSTVPSGSRFKRGTAVTKSVIWITCSCSRRKRIPHSNGLNPWGWNLRIKSIRRAALFTCARIRRSCRTAPAISKRLKTCLQNGATNLQRLWIPKRKV